MAQTPVPTGVSTPSNIEFNSFAPVVGINFGNSYASIAVLAKDGSAECIANEDGERQIACAVSFLGEEIYIGNQGKVQLVKNSKNTIINFRNILGKKFSEIPQPTSPSTSAPVIQHPTQPDTPAYKVDILIPAPSPLPHSHLNTPAASNTATPRSEPVPSSRTLTVSEVASIFLKSLLTSAEDFLGKKVEAAVLTVPSWWTQGQREALEKAAVDAGVPVVQLLEEAGAVAALTTSRVWLEDESSSPNGAVVDEDEDETLASTALLADRTQLIVDVGSSSTSLHLLSIRQGLSYILATSTHPTLGATLIDDKLIKHFAADFTKKTKIPLSVAPAPASSVSDARAEARLRLAIEHTKRTVSASAGAATCSVESLKDGFDYTGSINRMRFDMIAGPVYAAVEEAVVGLLSGAGVDASEVDEVVYVGGSAALSGLGERLGGGFSSGVRVKAVFLGGVGDPTSILARGSAVQAALVTALLKVHGEEKVEEAREVREAVLSGSLSRVKATTRTVGVLFPSAAEEHSELGGVFVPVVQKETALPVRRIVQLDVGVAETGKRVVALEVWEIKEGIRVEKVKVVPLPPLSDDEGSDEDEEEEEEIKHKIVSKEVLLGALTVEAKLAKKGKTTVQVQFIVGIEGELDAELFEVGGEAGDAARLHVPAP